jgi:c-di-GMP-binding flagellar brake protein YcgR
MTDPRKQTRVSIIGMVKVRHEGRRSILHALTINIGYGGIGIYIRQPLSGRVQVEISFSDSDGKDVAETIEGTVAWQKQVGNWHGVVFSLMTSTPTIT